jgi:predicted SAM-dependent methyltransferase
MLRKAVSILRSDGPVGLVDRGFRKLRGGHMRHFGYVRLLVEDKVGLEIGGPSKGIFGELVPTYRYAARVDNCNFAPNTIWETSLTEGENFLFSHRRRPGMQYICDASDLSRIPDETYDFVMSSHVIEHIANPIRALKEWRRILKPDGAAIFVVPHRDYGFDHRRPLTTLQHMLDDYERSTGDDDQTHLQETLDLVDYSMMGSDREKLMALGRDVLKTRVLHHHTFNEANFSDLLGVAGFNVLGIHFERPHQLIAAATKAPVVALEIRTFLESSGKCLRADISLAE